MSSKQGGRLHVGTKGRVEAASSNGHLYFLIVIDEFSQYVQVHLMVSKAEASMLLPNYLTRLENSLDI